MREGSSDPKWLLSDQLGSTSVVANHNGSLYSSKGYKAWGESRFGDLPAAYQFTGQFNQKVLGLYYYEARYYDPVLGRFTQADTLVPEGVQGSQAWDRYAYVNNNPLRYTDPSGNKIICPPDEPICDLEDLTPRTMIEMYEENNRGFIGNNDGISYLIEAYLEDNPKYDPYEDFYLDDPTERYYFHIFQKYRIEYWKERSNGNIGTAQANMYYYDFGIKGDILKWEPSRVNWSYVGLDTVSFVLSFFALNEISASLKLSKPVKETALTVSYITDMSLCL